MLCVTCCFVNLYKVLFNDQNLALLKIKKFKENKQYCIKIPYKYKCQGKSSLHELINLALQKI